MEKSSSTIQLNRLKQLDRYFGTEATVVDSQTLARVMSCSTRNVAKTMKNLTELGWIKWQPGRGRGIKTKLHIVQSFHDVLSNVLKAYVAKGELDEASRYADIFQYQSVFKQNLPEWMAEFSDGNEHSDKLISLVPYPLPACHPMHMIDRNSGLYVSAMFDTLIQYDESSQTFTPHLAHQFYQEGLTYYFRIRPDVHFHNGELLTPSHVKQVLLKHQKTNVIANELYLSIQSIEVDHQWLEITLTHNDPIFLHALADIHAAIFLENSAEPDFPYGTGAYHWASKNSDKWTLLKNTQYFGHHGIIKSADFWHVLDTNKTSMGHLFEFEDTDTIEDNLQTLKTSDLGSKGLCMSHRLDDHYRKSIATIAHQVLAEHYEGKHQLCHSLFNQPSKSIETTKSHNNIELPNHLKVLQGNSDAIQQLWHRLSEMGVRIEFVDDLQKAEVWVNNFLVGNDPLLDHYYWLLLSESAINLLTPFKQQQWLTEVIQADNIQVALSQIEQRYLVQNRIVPLWRKSIAFQSHRSLRGTDINSLGFMNISKIWFDKRES